MKNFFLGVLATILFFSIATFAYLRLGFTEVRADAPVPRIESWLMVPSVRASVRRQAPEIRNPIPPTDETLIAGGKIYFSECSGCHGDLEPGKGGSATALIPAPPQFSSVGSDFTEAQIFWVAKHGIRRSGMFVNGQWDSDERLWQVSAFIKRIRSLSPSVRAAILAPVAK
ncbi:MAG TPA: cytochrome c [Candidatus Dormibacteraeota bacterium]|jgi:mono/diheme cytochrome c family protein|nr:cytochrome c [Candidatus Dormibacteraeota bacterium]